jgi:hypothetical protein
MPPYTVASLAKKNMNVPAMAADEPMATPAANKSPSANFLNMIFFLFGRRLRRPGGYGTW